MKKGFSLIELIVVIAITAVILAVALPNFLSARERARDAKRKEEANALKQALRMYYNDYQVYPTNATCGGNKVNYILGCGAAANECCPCNTAVDFAVGESCETVYMKKLPSDLGSSMRYHPVIGSTDDFCIRVLLDNKGDSDIATSQARCAGACGANCTGSYYCVCAD